MTPEQTAWLANLRAEASAPGALLATVDGPRGSVAIFPRDVVGRSDAELLAFVEARLAE